MPRWTWWLPLVILGSLLWMQDARAADPVCGQDSKETERKAFCGRAWAIPDLRDDERESVYCLCMGEDSSLYKPENAKQIANRAVQRLGGSGWKLAVLVELLDKGGALDPHSPLEQEHQQWLGRLEKDLLKTKTKTKTKNKKKANDTCEPLYEELLKLPSSSPVSTAVEYPPPDKKNKKDRAACQPLHLCGEDTDEEVCEKRHAGYALQMLFTPPGSELTIMAGKEPRSYEPTKVLPWSGDAASKDAADIWMVVLPSTAAYTVVLEDPKRWDTALVVTRPSMLDGSLLDLRNIATRCLNLQFATNPDVKSQILLDGHPVKAGTVRVPVRVDEKNKVENAPSDVQLMLYAPLTASKKDDPRWRPWYRTTIAKPKEIFEHGGKCHTITADIRDWRKVVLLDVPESQACAAAGANREVIWRAGKKVLETYSTDGLGFSDMRGLASVVGSLRSLEAILASSNDEVDRGAVDFSAQHSDAADRLWQAGARRVMSLSVHCAVREDRSRLTVVGHRLDLDLLVLGGDPSTQSRDENVALTSTSETVADPAQLDRAAQLVMTRLLEEPFPSLTISHAPRTLHEPLRVAVDVSRGSKLDSEQVHLRAYNVPDAHAESVCRTLVESGGSKTEAFATLQRVGTRLFVLDDKESRMNQRREARKAKPCVRKVIGGAKYDEKSKCRVQQELLDAPGLERAKDRSKKPTDANKRRLRDARMELENAKTELKNEKTELKDANERVRNAEEELRKVTWDVFNEDLTATAHPFDELPRAFEVGIRRPETVVLRAWLTRDEKPMSEVYACVPIEQRRFSVWADGTIGWPILLDRSVARASNLDRIDSPMLMVRARAGIDRIFTTQRAWLDLTIGPTVGYSSISRAVSTLPSWNDVPLTETLDTLRWRRHSMLLGMKAGFMIKGCSSKTRSVIPCSSRWRRLLFFFDMSPEIDIGFIDASEIPAEATNFRRGHRNDVFVDADIGLTGRVGVGARLFPELWVGTYFMLALYGLDDLHPARPRAERGLETITYDGLVVPSFGFVLGWMR